MRDMLTCWRAAGHLCPGQLYLSRSPEGVEGLDRAENPGLTVTRPYTPSEWDIDG